MPKFKNAKFIIAFTAFTAILVYIYYIINPTESEWIPKCAFKQLTGYECPSCGSQRAIHKLLHGDIRNAFMLNPFAFISALYLLTIIYTTVSESQIAEKIKKYILHKYTIYAYLTLLFAWWFIRNHI